jgi:hypothetical protein
MLQLKNTTPFTGALMLLADRDGVDTVVAVVKATLTTGPQLTLADEQVPVALGDKHYADPASSSVRVPSDVSLGKPGTDVLLVGSAWAPGGRPVSWMDVRMTVGQLSTTVRVFGDRFWDAGPAGALMTAPAPFQRIPLVWERAYGGTDETDKGPHAYPWNPVGTGFRGSGSTKPLAGLALPNLEDPTAPISSWKDTPRPAGVAPVAPHWDPRRSYAGTYDEAWQRSRAPYLPQDFDPRFFQLAPTGLHAPGYLRGGEWVDARGVTPGGHMQFQLPAVGVDVTFHLGNGRRPQPAVLDTVILEPDASRLVLVWRASVTCDKKALQVKEAEIALRRAA